MCVNACHHPSTHPTHPPYSTSRERPLLYGRFVAALEKACPRVLSEAQAMREEWKRKKKKEEEEGEGKRKAAGGVGGGGWGAVVGQGQDAGTKRAEGGFAFGFSFGGGQE